MNRNHRLSSNDLRIRDKISEDEEEGKLQNENADMSQSNDRVSQKLKYNLTRRFTFHLLFYKYFERLPFF